MADTDLLRVETERLLASDPAKYATDIYQDIIAIACATYLEAGERGENSIDRLKLLEKIQQKHMVFTRQYPLVIRYMVIYGEYVPSKLQSDQQYIIKTVKGLLTFKPYFDSKTFEKYIKLLKAKRPESKEDVIWQRALWVKMMHVYHNPKGDKAYATRLMETTYRALKKEEEEMQAAMKNAEKIIQDEDKQIHNERRGELSKYINFYRQNKKNISDNKQEDGKQED